MPTADLKEDIFSDEFDLEELHRAVILSHKELWPFREARDMFTSEYAGPHHGYSHTKMPNSNNSIRRYVDINRRLLAPGDPRVTISTFDPDLKATANSLQKAVNQKIIDIDLGTVIEGAVTEALFSFGIIKVGLNHSGTIEMGGLRHNTSEVFAEVVEFNNFTWDLEAARPEMAQFMADRVNIPLKDLKASGLFEDVDIEKAVKGASLHKERSSDDLPSSEKVSQSYRQDPYRDSVDVWQVWLPFENRTVVILDAEEPILLRNVEYYGPEHGPYSLLGLGDVPGNIMPASPVANLFELHRQLNRINRKVEMQTDRSKSILGVKDRGAADADAIKNSRDGQIIRFQHPDLVKEFKFGGADPGLVAMGGVIDESFNKNAGNIDQTGGLSSQADTLGQEKLLSENASIQIQGMARKVDKLAKSVIKAIAWFVHDDPTSITRIKKEVPGVKDVTIFSQFGPEDRTADFIDYDIQIQPYSLNSTTPQQQVNSLISLMGTLLLPIEQQLNAQGLEIDYATIITHIGDMSNMPILSEAIKTQDGTTLTNRERETDSGGSTPNPGKVSHNVRHNVTPDDNSNPIQELQTAQNERES